MKLKTKIEHLFNIELDSIDDLDFNVEIPLYTGKKKKIIEVKRHNFKKEKDVSTRLF